MMNLVNVLSKMTLNKNVDVSKETKFILNLDNAATFTIDRVKNLPLSYPSQASPASNLTQTDAGIFERDLIKNPSEADLGKLLKNHFGNQIILDKLKEQKSSKTQVGSKNVFTEAAKCIDNELWCNAIEVNSWHKASLQAGLTDELWSFEATFEAFWTEEIQQNQHGWFSSEDLASYTFHQVNNMSEAKVKKKEAEEVAKSKKTISWSLFPTVQSIPVPVTKNDQSIEFERQYAQWQRENITQSTAPQNLSQLYDGVDRLEFMQGFFNLALHFSDVDFAQQSQAMPLSSNKVQKCELALHDAFAIKLTLLANILFEKTLKTLQLNEQVQEAKTENEKQALINKLAHAYNGIEQTIYFTYMHFYKKFQQSRSIDLNALSENESLALLEKLAKQKQNAIKLANSVNVAAEVKEKYEIKARELLSIKLSGYQKSAQMLASHIAEDGKIRLHNKLYDLTAVANELAWLGAEETLFTPKELAAIAFLIPNLLAEDFENTHSGLRRAKRRAYGPGPYNTRRAQILRIQNNKIAKARREKIALVHKVMENKGDKDLEAILAAGDALKEVLSMGPTGTELQSLFTHYDLPDHSRDLLKFHLPSEGVMDAFHHTAIFKHCDPRELLQIVELFSPQLQFTEMLGELERQVIELILDKTMTNQQRIQFRINYLASFRNRVMRMSETELLAIGIKKTFSGNVLNASGYSLELLADGVKSITGGPFGIGILAQQVYDVNHGYQMSSLSVEQIHALELGATLFGYAIGFIPIVGEAAMVVSGTVDFIEALSASKSDVCEYIKDGISVGMGAKGLVHRSASYARGTKGQSSDLETPDVFKERQGGKYAILKGIYRRLASLARVDTLLEKLQKRRDKDYEDYQEVCRAKRGIGSSKGCMPYPSSDLTDSLNRDYKENAEQWCVINPIISSLRVAMVEGKLSSSDFDKASALLTAENRFSDYEALFGSSQKPAFGFNKPLSRTGFLSFVAKNDLTQVIHTAYIHAGRMGSSTLFTEGRLDLDEILNPVAQGRPAASAFSYELTPEVQEKLRQWCGFNGYEAKFTEVSELVRKVKEHPYSETTSDVYDFMRGYDVSLKNEVLTITNNGVESLIAMPSGLMTAKNIVRYLQRKHHDKLTLATKVDLQMSNSGKGETWNSQAQETANLLGLPVIGYEQISNQQDAANKVAASEQKSETFYPQTSNKKILTRVMNEMIGDRQRSTYLRVQPDWAKVPIEQLFERIQEYPKDFLQENSLVTAALDVSKPIFLSKMGEHKYQLSNIAMPESAEIKLGFFEDFSETDVDLSTLEGIPLSSLDSNFISTSQQTGCTLAVKTVGSETYVTFVKPSAELGDPNRDVNLQNELETYGWHTLGPKDYKGSPTSFFGVKEHGKWHFYRQDTLYSTSRVSEIFTNTDTTRLEDLTVNHELKEIIHATKEALFYPYFEGLSIADMLKHSVTFEEGIVESDSQLLEKQFSAYPDLSAKIANAQLISPQEFESIATDTATNYPYPLVTVEGKSQRYALAYTDGGTELLFKEETEGGNQKLVLVDGYPEQANQYEITQDGDHIKQRENPVLASFTKDEIRVKLDDAMIRKAKIENLLQHNYEQKEELALFQANLEKNIPEMEKLLQTLEVSPKITEYLGELKTELQAVKERISAIDTFKLTGIKQFNFLSNFVELLKQNLINKETLSVLEERIKIAHKGVSLCWLAYKKAANVFYSSRNKTAQELSNLREDKELKWREYEQELSKLEDLKSQNQLLKKSMIAQEASTLEDVANGNAKKELEKNKRCRRANESCTASTSQADPAELPINREIENEFWQKFETPLSKRDFKQAFGELLKTNCEINTELEEQIRGMQTNNLEKLKLVSQALFRRVLSYQAKSFLDSANQVMQLTKAMPHLADSKAQEMGRDQVLYKKARIKQAIDDVFVQDYGKYQDLIQGELDRLSQAQVSHLLSKLEAKLEKTVQSAFEIHVDFTSLASNLAEFKQFINEAFEENIFDPFDPARAELTNQAYRASLFAIASADMLDPNIEITEPVDFGSRRIPNPLSFYLKKRVVVLDQLKVLKLSVRSKILQLIQLENAISAKPSSTLKEKISTTRVMLDGALKKCADKILEHNLYRHILNGPRKNQPMEGWSIDEMQIWASTYKKIIGKVADSLAKNLETYNKAVDEAAGEEANSDEIKAKVEARLQHYLQESGMSILNTILSNPEYRDLVVQGGQPSESEQAQAAANPSVQTRDPNPLNPSGVAAFYKIMAAIDGQEEVEIVPTSFVDSHATYPAKFYAMKLVIASRRVALSLFELKLALLKNLSSHKKKGLLQLISTVKHINEHAKLTKIFAEQKQNQPPLGKPVSRLPVFVRSAGMQLNGLEQEIGRARDAYRQALSQSEVTDARVNAELREHMKSYKGAKVILRAILKNKEYLTTSQQEVYEDDNGIDAFDPAQYRYAQSLTIGQELLINDAMNMLGIPVEIPIDDAVKQNAVEVEDSAANSASNSASNVASASENLPSVPHVRVEKQFLEQVVADENFAQDVLLLVPKLSNRGIEIFNKMQRAMHGEPLVDVPEAFFRQLPSKKTLMRVYNAKLAFASREFVCQLNQLKLQMLDVMKFESTIIPEDKASSDVKFWQLNQGLTEGLRNLVRKSAEYERLLQIVEQQGYERNPDGMTDQELHRFVQKLYAKLKELGNKVTRTGQKLNDALSEVEHVNLSAQARMQHFFRSQLYLKIVLETLEKEPECSKPLVPIVVAALPHDPLPPAALPDIPDSSDLGGDLLADIMREVGIDIVEPDVNQGSELANSDQELVQPNADQGDAQSGASQGDVQPNIGQGDVQANADQGDVQLNAGSGQAGGSGVQVQHGADDVRPKSEGEILAEKLRLSRQDTLDREAPQKAKEYKKRQEENDRRRRRLAQRAETFRQASYKTRLAQEQAETERQLARGDERKQELAEQKKQAQRDREREANRAGAAAKLGGRFEPYRVFEEQGYSVAKRPRLDADDGNEFDRLLQSLELPDVNVDLDGQTDFDAFIADVLDPSASSSSDAYQSDSQNGSPRFSRSLQDENPNKANNRFFKPQINFH